jgi:hypothetical protein
MSHVARTYRGFTITSTVLGPEKATGKIPRLPARALARRGRILIEGIQPVGGEWDENVRAEIDRLLDPALLRNVLNLN